MDYEYISLALVFLLFLSSALVYDSLSGSLATHWNAEGKADGFASKSIGAFLLPAIGLAIFALFRWLSGRKEFHELSPKLMEITVLIIGFLLYLHLASLAFNLGYGFNFTQVLSPGFGLLFIGLGIMIRDIKKNYLIGIRTPWSMMDSRVWKKTHEFGSKLFIAAGVISIIGSLFPALAIWFMIVPVILAALISMAYSYFEFSRMKRPRVE